MVERPFWLERFRRAWKRAPIVWLSGPRRAGKTTLAQQVPGARVLNCDLPSVQQRVSDLELFYAQVDTDSVLVFDEVHQLENPSRLLKVGADTVKGLRILATGSSTLAATSKFKDTLTGRKRTIELVPVMVEELEAFDATLEDRLLKGGLPPALLSNSVDGGFYAEWLDSYFARDVQELFRVERRAGFLALAQALLRQSGGLVEVSKLNRAAGLSRPTVNTYLEVLETTHLIRVLRPYHAGSTRELWHQPRIYGFDTGFVCHARGWDRLRPEDKGGLWEHLVLESLVAHGIEGIGYWRDKSQHEVDFVVPAGRGVAHAVECKWSPSDLNAVGLEAFRAHHAKGKNFLVCPRIKEPFRQRAGTLEVEVLDLPALCSRLEPSKV